MEMTQENEFIFCLKSMVLNYLEKNPHLTVNSLAQRANISPTSLRRLLGGGQKNEVAPHSVLNLVSYILRERDLIKLLNKLDQKIASFLSKHFGHYIFAHQMQLDDLNLEKKLSDQTKFLIYKMARHHQGLSEKILVKNFGQLGKIKMDEMIKDGLIFEESGTFHVVNKKYPIPLNVVAQNLAALIEFSPPEFHLDNMRHFSHMSESLNKGAIEEITKIQDEAFDKIERIISDQKSLGDIPFFYLNLSEMMNLEVLV
jgi:hypothetical protein